MRCCCLPSTRSTLAAFWLGCALPLFGPSRAAAEPATAPATSARPPALCATKSPDGKAPSSLSALVCSLLERLPRVAPTTRVITVLMPEAIAAKRAELSDRVSNLVASELGAINAGHAASSHHGGPVSERPSPLLVLEMNTNAGRFGVNATLYAAQLGFWARTRGQAPRVLSHTYSDIPQTAEVRSYLPPVPLVAPTVSVHQSPVAQVNALSCGDLNDDGSLDVVVSNRHAIVLGHLTPERLVPSWETPWATLSGVAGVPLKQPLASLFITSEQTVEASSTDRGDWVRLDQHGQLLSRAQNNLGVGPGVCIPRHVASLEAMPGPCLTPSSANDQTSVLLDRVVTYTPPTQTDAIATARRDPLQSRVSVHGPWGTRAYPQSGDALVVTDLNLDGTLELLSSTNTLDPSQDRLQLHELPGPQAVGKPTQAPLWDIPVPNGVNAVAACPANTSGQAAVLLASNDQIWVLSAP